MSGILSDDPDLRFFRRLRLFVSRISGFALMLFRWVAKADRSGRSNSRQLEVEFPAAQTVYQLPKRALWGSPAADRASIDALHPHNNWVNIEDQYEISSIREKLAAFARRVPIQGRSSPGRFARGRQNAGQENILATRRRAFFQWKNGEQANRVIAQRFAGGATGAQA